MFLPADSSTPQVEVALEEGIVDCGLDVAADGRFVEVGLDPFGGGADVERFAWGAAGSQVSERSISDGAAQLEIGDSRTLIEVDDGVGSSGISPPEINVRAEDGTSTITVVSDRMVAAQLHGFDGRTFLVRLEPAEPVCDRGFVYAINVATGNAACVDGRMLAILLVGQASSPASMTVPNQIDPVADGCTDGLLTDLLRVMRE